MLFDALIFDLDGTLADTADDIAASVGHAMRAEGFSAPSRETVVGAIGAGVGKLVERLVPEASKRGAVLSAFMGHYGEHLLDRTRLYPGVPETLTALHSVPMGVLTNKPIAFTRRILEALGIAHHFRVVCGGDSLPVRKPDPAAVRPIVAELGGSCALLVGDSGVDVETARSAGVACAVVAYGYHKPGELDGADYVVDRFAGVLDLVRPR